MSATPEWHRLAACKSAPELYYGTEGERPRQKAVRERQAKRICEGCPVLLDCLADALGTPEVYGYRGGKSEDERRKLRKAMRRRELAQGRGAA